MSFKNIFLTSTVMFLVLLLGACGENEDASGEKSDEWLEEAELDADESTEDLYEEAKSEDEELTVYSQTSATEQVVNSFNEEYPDIDIEVTKISNAEMLERLRREHEGDVEGADVVFSKDANGAFKNELVDEGLLHGYKPDVIKDQLKEQFVDYQGLPVITEAIVPVYNTDAYEEPPIDNWWELTKSEWKGKITMSDPLDAADHQDVFSTIVQHSDEMEEAYREEFGEELELNGTENAGYEFIKRLLENDAVLRSSSGDAVDTVAETSNANSPIAIASTVKLRDVKDGEPLSMVNDLKPKTSVPGTKQAFINDGSPNVNSAKLFIRWLAGGDDGEGEGFEPLSTPGTYSVRDDIEQDFDVPKLDDLDLWEEDLDYHYKNASDMNDFLIQIE